MWGSAQECGETGPSVKQDAATVNAERPKGIGTVLCTTRLLIPWHHRELPQVSASSSNQLYLYPNQLPADAGLERVPLLANLLDSNMSVSANCLSGYRATLASRPPWSSSVFATILAIRPGTLFQRQVHSAAVKPQLSACAGSLTLSLTRSRPLSLQPHVSQATAIARYASQAEPRDDAAELPTSPPFSAGKYENLTIGVPKEIYPGERRVAITPQNVALLLKKGFSRILIEKSAGVEAQFTDEVYEQAGAKTVDRRNVFAEADILLKVRPLSTDGAESEVDAIRDGATVISFLYPVQNKPTVERIASRKATAFAMDMVPRISRAQVFDALSSMANIAGYKAVLEASNTFGRFLTGQVTAAGKIPPCKVLVIGAGVAGLSAIATARRMGAIVRGFDTRSAAREQVQSLGAEFIEVTGVEEDGSGAGGYAKVMSKAFIEAEMKLFHEQCRDVDIVITTALIPGKPAPKLITKAMLGAMKPGSVVVDLAAEAGGNCEATVPGELSKFNGVSIIGQDNVA
jgi:NAD(P) transhydrogenase